MSTMVTARPATAPYRRAMPANDQAPTLPSALERLAAGGPHRAEQTDLMLYGRLVGAWDVDWVNFDAEGQPRDRRRGEWHFAWVLGGRGVQDVIWTVGQPAANDGTTLRCWNSQQRIWHVIFMSPADGEFVSLTGRRDGDQIVQDVIARNGDAAPRRLHERWNFSDISPTGFLWQAATSPDDGRTWHVTHEMTARRSSPQH